MVLVLSAAIAAEISGAFTAKVPPNSQHSSAWAGSSTVTRDNWPSSAAAAGATAISRRAEQD
jgi:hypothetical protein